MGDVYLYHCDNRGRFFFSVGLGYVINTFVHAFDSFESTDIESEELSIFEMH